MRKDKNYKYVIGGGLIGLGILAVFGLLSPFDNRIFIIFGFLVLIGVLEIDFKL